jgi:hypothetical protein
MSRRPIFDVIVALALVVCGCATSGSSDRFSALKRPAKPNRMVLLASASQMENNGQAPEPGMLCRIYFFEGSNPNPVKVSGDFELTAIDRSLPAAAGKPHGVYRVPAEQLPQHLRKDIVGNSYLFWLPYQPKQKTQLVVQGRFRSSKGADVVTSLTSVDLAPSLSVEALARTVGPTGEAVAQYGSTRIPQVVPIDRANAEPPKTEVFDIPLPRRQVIPAVANGLASGAVVTAGGARPPVATLKPPQPTATDHPPAAP